MFSQVERERTFTVHPKGSKRFHRQWVFWCVLCEKMYIKIKVKVKIHERVSLERICVNVAIVFVFVIKCGLCKEKCTVLCQMCCINSPPRRWSFVPLNYRTKHLTCLGEKNANRQTNARVRTHTRTHPCTQLNRILPMTSSLSSKCHSHNTSSLLNWASKCCFDQSRFTACVYILIFGVCVCVCLCVCWVIFVFW